MKENIEHHIEEEEGEMFKHRPPRLRRPRSSTRSAQRMEARKEAAQRELGVPVLSLTPRLRTAWGSCLLCLPLAPRRSAWWPRGLALGRAAFPGEAIPIDDVVATVLGNAVTSTLRSCAKGRKAPPCRIDTSQR